MAMPKRSGKLATQQAPKIKSGGTSGAYVPAKTPKNRGNHSKGS